MAKLQWQRFNGKASMAKLQWQSFNGKASIEIPCVFACLLLYDCIV
jgi:hypothetical protein